MKRMILILLCLPCFLFAQEDKEKDIWKPLRYFIGTWMGESTGKAGEGKGTSTFEFVMKDAYVFCKNSMKFEPKENNPQGEVHEDWAIFSYDTGRKQLIIRQFNVERFVNTFVLDSLSSDNKILVFITESSENAPPGLTARMTYQVKSENEFVETFDLGFPGREFSCWMTNTWKRR